MRSRASPTVRSRAELRDVGVEQRGQLRRAPARRTTDSPFPRPPHDEIEAHAIVDERRLFAANVQRWRAQPNLRTDPVPYRRVLTLEESSAWRTSLQRRSPTHPTREPWRSAVHSPPVS